MKKQGWTYLKENISTDNPVAYFINRKGNRVFYVVEIRDGYITTDVMDGIKSRFISYSEAMKMNSDAENAKSDRDVLFSALIHACEKFEENYYEQANHLLEQF